MDDTKKNTEYFDVNLNLVIENNNAYRFSASIESALRDAKTESEYLNSVINENLSTIKSLTPECDKLDYALAASSGALCAVIDIFLVDNPKDSVLTKLSDNWFKERTKDFAKLVGWSETSPKTPIEYLECKFPVPYDQTGMKDSGKQLFDLDLKNHHFKSLAHNPSLLGLFFSFLFITFTFLH